VTGDQTFDVFISYRQRDPDRAWVRDRLVPALRGCGVRVFIDYEEFRLGAPLMIEMARGVEQSRYTLAVLTPEYLASGYTELESILAEHLGIERGERRLLAIMRAPCQPRLGIRARLWLDMVDDAGFSAGIAKLASELAGESTEPPS
jgi:hypothetical protein